MARANRHLLPGFGIKENDQSVRKHRVKLNTELKAQAENPGNYRRVREHLPKERCNKKKDYSGCHECDDFPCQFVEGFPVPVGKKVVLRSVPYRKKWGTETWVKDDEARYACPDCGHPVFRGAKRCNKCKVEVDLD